MNANVLMYFFVYRLMIFITIWLLFILGFLLILKTFNKEYHHESPKDNPSINIKTEKISFVIKNATSGLILFFLGILSLSIMLYNSPPSYEHQTQSITNETAVDSQKDEESAKLSSMQSTKVYLRSNNVSKLQSIINNYTDGRYNAEDAMNEIVNVFLEDE